MTQWGLDTLFNPAKRHMDEEKRRLQSTREEVGDNSGGRRIDLESGKVVIRKADDEDGDPDSDIASDTAGGGSPGQQAGTADDAPAAVAAKATAPAEPAAPAKAKDKEKGKGEPSAAAQRAAARRGRTAR